MLYNGLNNYYWLKYTLLTFLFNLKLKLLCKHLSTGTEISTRTACQVTCVVIMLRTECQVKIQAGMDSDRLNLGTFLKCMQNIQKTKNEKDFLPSLWHGSWMAILKYIRNTWWITMCPDPVNTYNFGDPLTFPFVPPASQSFTISTYSILAKLLMFSSALAVLCVQRSSLWLLFLESGQDSLDSGSVGQSELRRIIFDVYSCLLRRGLSLLCFNSAASVSGDCVTSPLWVYSPQPSCGGRQTTAVAILPVGLDLSIKILTSQTPFSCLLWLR